MTQLAGGAGFARGPAFEIRIKASRSDQRDGVPRVFGIAAELRLAADPNWAHCHRCQRASSMEVITAFENGQKSVIDFGQRLTCHCRDPGTLFSAVGERDGNWLIRSEVYVALQGAGSGLQMKDAPRVAVFETIDDSCQVG